jgi:integrase
MNREESFRVGRGKASIGVWPVNTATLQGWRFKKPGGQVVTRKSKEEAARLAREYAKGRESVDSYLDDLGASDRAILAYILKRGYSFAELETIFDLHERKARSLKLREVVHLYKAEKIQMAGELTDHLRQVVDLLDSLVESHGETPMGQVGSDLAQWFDQRVGGLSAATNNNIRANLLGLWNWAAKMGYITADELLCASRLRRLKKKTPEIRIATNSEALFLLSQVEEEFRLALVLSLFAGLRPEQAAAKTSGSKTGLRREAISTEDEVIFISREVSKTVSHIVPLSDCLLAWLTWAGWVDGQVGAVARRSMAEAKETKRLGLLMDSYFDRDEGWPHDFLRHTYGSMRNAICRNLSQVAEEMGTSAKMMADHYHQPRPRKDGEAFFALRPNDLETIPGVAVVDQEFSCVQLTRRAITP